MRTAPLHPEENRRLAALARLRLLDTAPEERFDRITRLAARLLGTPIALVSLVDADRQWFKSAVGLDASETPRAISFCAHAVADPSCDRLVIADASCDERFRDNPLVVEDPGIRFYAGQVLHDPAGYPVGTLCTVDVVPRELSVAELATLADLAAMAEAELARTDEIDALVRLDESERAKATLLDSLEEGLVMFDAAGRVVEWNRRAERILGLSPAELADRAVDDPPFDVVQADGSPWDPAALPGAVSVRAGIELTDQTMGFERDGERRWIRVRTRPVLDTSGHVDCVVAAFTDITDELSVRSTSAALTERLRAAVDDSPLGIALADRLGRFTYVNESYATILGIDRHEAVGHLAVEQIHPDDVHVGQEEIAELMRGDRRQVTLEFRVVARDGSIRHVRSHASRLDPATTDAAYLVQVEDVSERHALEATLRSREERSRASLDALDQGVLLVGADHRVHLMNHAAAEILGTDREGLEGRLRSGTPTTWNESGEPVPVGARAVDLALSGGVAVRRRVVGWRRDDGTEVLLRLSALPTRLDGDRTGAVVAFTDITERRAIELELERYGILFEHANDIITVIGADGTIRYASPSNGRVLGYDDGWRPPAGGVLGLVHPDDLPAAEAELAALIGGERDDQRPFTVRVRAADGAWRHLECVGVNLLDEPSVRGVVLTSRDVSDRQRLVEELAHRATHDLLTGLPNRSVLTDTVEAAAARASRSGGRIALCYLDLDGFKAVNDTHGHAAGDQLLVTVADRIRGAVRAGDTPARIGGDEFVVVLDPVAGEGDARRAAERIRDAVLADGLGIDGVECGVSVGVAVALPGERPDHLTARADAALYASKTRGGCSVELAAA